MTNIQFFYEEYLKPIKIITNSIKYKPMNALNNAETEQLAKLYMTVFNSDNKNLMAKLNIKGRTVKEGLWGEEPYTYEKTLQFMKDYKMNPYFGLAVEAMDINAKEQILGAYIVEEKTLSELQKRDYIVPFEIPIDTTFWCVLDAFRRLFTDENNILIHGFSIKMQNELVNMFGKDISHLLLYSSTNNPQMVNSWKKDDWSIVEKPTSFGNKFQAFKLVK